MSFDLFGVIRQALKVSSRKVKPCPGVRQGLLSSGCTIGLGALSPHDTLGAHGAMLCQQKRLGLRRAWQDHQTACVGPSAVLRLVGLTSLA